MPVLRINEVTVCSYSMEDALALLAKANIKIDQPFKITIESSNEIVKLSYSTRFYLDGVEYFTDSPQEVANLVGVIVVKPAQY